jgi:hypothetical protein
MRAKEAFVIGIGGGIAMIAATWLARFVAACTDVPMLWGTMFLPASPEAWLLGALIQLLILGVAGLLYAWAFEHLTQHAGALTGVLFSLVHSLIGGIALGLVVRVHPRVPEAMPAPGWWALHYGAWGFIVLVLAHAVYGAVVGAAYEPAGARAHRAPRSALT